MERSKNIFVIVYKIVNEINGKIYIGKTIWSLKKRWIKHMYHVRKGTNRYLYDAISCYGVENFKIETIEECYSLGQLNEQEKFWIKKCDTMNKENGYNMTDGGTGGKLPDDIIEKIAEKKRGVPLTEQHKKKISIALKGKGQGIPLTEKTRKKISNTMKRFGIRPPLNIMPGKDHPMFGKHHTEEAKKKISQARTGKTTSDKQKEIAREKWIGNGNPNYVEVDEGKLKRAIQKGLIAEEIAQELNISRPTVFSKIRSFWNMSGGKKKMERKLASLQRISEVKEHENADNLEICRILGWQVITKKGEFKSEDVCIFCEIDSILPEKPEFEFLRPKKFRIKTCKLRQKISQGIAFPIDIIPKDKAGEVMHMEIGDDVSDIIGVTKYVAPVPACLAGRVKGNFPSFIPKTDETRIQSVPKVIERNKIYPCYATEKLDGTSVTYYLKDDDFNVCSRNLNMKTDNDNTYWQVAKKRDIEGMLRYAGTLKGNSKNLAIQGEIIGNGIQKNKYRMEGKDVFAFDVFDIDEYKYFSYERLSNFCHSCGLRMVPVVDESFYLGYYDLEGLVELSKGASKIYKYTQREGIVIRSALSGVIDPELGRLSFKVVNPDFLLKHDE